jgi:hypothetical protein
LGVFLLSPLQENIRLAVAVVDDVVVVVAVPAAEVG